MNHIHGWINYDPGDKQKLLQERRRVVEDERTHKLRITKSEYGKPLISWRRTWPHKLFENGIVGEFIFYVKGRRHFKKWDEINKIYHLHLESPTGSWEVLQLESFDCEILPIDLLHENKKEMFLDLLKSIYLEIWNDIYFEVPMSLSYYNNPLHGRHDVLGNKKKMFMNNEFAEFEYIKDVVRMINSQKRKLKLTIYGIAIFLIPTMIYQISIRYSLLGIHDIYIFHIFAILSCFALVVLILAAIVGWITIPFNPESNGKSDDE